MNDCCISKKSVKICTFVEFSYFSNNSSMHYHLYHVYQFLNNNIWKMYVINRIIHWYMDVCTVQRQLIAFKSCIPVYIKATIVDIQLRDSRTF